VDEEGVEDFSPFYGEAAAVHGCVGNRRGARRRRDALTRRRRLESIHEVVHGEDLDVRDVRPPEPSPRPRASVGVPLPTGSDPHHLSKFFCINSN
jgi:hypothetical protein